MNQATDSPGQLRFIDAHPAPGDYRSEILEGLGRPQKRIDPKWFYDHEGSQLFDAITRLPEYYPTRTESALLQNFCEEISEHCGRGCVFIEPGSGSSEKVRLLLDALRPAAYVPLDISSDFLRAAATDLAAAYPWLPITAICADFRAFRDVDSEVPEGRRVIFYPGSTIGNLEPAAAQEFLRSLHGVIGSDGGVLVGVDLHKSTARLEAAYNDSAGVTARFNLNVLTHINRLLDADFDLDGFEHRAFYNASQRRVEMHLVSRREQTVHCAGAAFEFRLGESLHTENSYKYSVEDFAALAEASGLRSAASWIDDDGLFSLHYLAPDLAPDRAPGVSE